MGLLFAAILVGIFAATMTLLIGGSVAAALLAYVVGGIATVMLLAALAVARQRQKSARSPHTEADGVAAATLLVTIKDAS